MSWEVHFIPQAAEPRDSSFATFNLRTNGTTATPVLEFDDASSEYMVFSDTLPLDYDDTKDIEIDVYFAMASATSGNVRITILMARIGLDTLDLDSTHFSNVGDTDDIAVSATAGKVKKGTFTMINATDGEGTDEALPGDPFRIMIQRVGSHANDTASGDMHLIRVVVREASA